MQAKGIYFIYRSLQALGFPLLLLYLLYRGCKSRAYWRSLRQRFGFLPSIYKQTAPGAIWLHAVSVGEVLACTELVQRLRRESPRTPLFVSVSTIAGRALAEEKLQTLTNGIFYAPLDYVFAVRRVLRALQPSVLVVAETEIWPNLYREVKRIEGTLMVVNGRISERAAPRYLQFRWLFRAVLSHCDLILAQTESIASLYGRIGAPPEIVRVGSNLKYDFQPTEAGRESPVRALLERLRPAHVWIAASTMPPRDSADVDEDEAVIAAFAQLSRRLPGLLLIMAPRRPERFDAVAEKLRQASIPHLRRSALLPDSEMMLPGVLLLDSIGELSGLFVFADVVFMGGTLARRGGHNILEPAFFARPVIIGPHMENFQEIANEFRAADACVEISGPEELDEAVSQLLLDPARARRVGERARVCAEAKRGATELALRQIHDFHRRSWPRYRPSSAALLCLWPLQKLWIWGGNRKRRRALANQKSLNAAVISVGNLTMGGTGKTPAVLRLAQRLKEAGHRPCILTRGYGRKSPQRFLVLDAGARVPVTLTGDEAQMFLKGGIAPVGIGADRFAVGRLVQQRFPTDVVILDDGFQHRRLARQLDIVLIDALDPFGGKEAFPVGRLREPMQALARASLFVITRADSAAALDAIEHQLRQHNPNAPVFHAHAVAEYWQKLGSAERMPASAPPFQRPGAFCGLGNPASFWRTLDALGIKTVERVEFSDHHSYRPQELRRMAEHFRRAGADAMVTTEKDLFNLCEDCEPLISPLPLYWLKIRIEVDREAELLERILHEVSLVK